MNTRNLVIRLLFVFVVVSVSLALGSSAAQADEPPGPKPAPRQLVVRHDPTYNPHRVPAPPPRDPDEIGIQAVSFNINFDNGAGCGGGSYSAWPQAAKDAFNYAANQWSALLDGTVAINIHACWQSNLPPGVLGGASHEWVHSFDFDNEPIANSWYPTALADQLDGSNTNPGSYDIDATFSSSFNWYFGTDGNPLPAQVDFVSVVMHEIGHGLGFAGLMTYGASSCGNASWGCWGYGSGYPGVYDRFTENGSGQVLLNTALFPNPSAALGSQLTSNNLFFDGINANAANGGTPVKIYAPSTWSPGSSYAHLDEIYNGTPHAMMTYSLSSGESEHHPGSVTLGMFEDMGWTSASSAAPTAPSGLNATAVSQTQINLSWTDNSSDETGFKIERSPNGTSAWLQIGSVSADDTTYNDSNGLDCGTAYYYRVRAYNAYGDSDYSNTASATTDACSGPTPPSDLTVTGASSNQIDLSWTDNSGAEDGFIIWRSLNGVVGWTQVGTVGADVTTFGDSTVVAGTTYYYRVNAFVGTDYSAYSNIVSATAGLQVFLPLIFQVWP